jgi:predicted GNAT superfamily acetyltransferase
MGPGRDAAWLTSALPTVNMSYDWLGGGGEVYSYTHIAGMHR